MKHKGDLICYLGMALVTAGVACLSIPWAMIVLGSILFTASVYGAVK